MYYTHPGCRTSILGENRAYCIRDFTVNVMFLFHSFIKALLSLPSVSDVGLNTGICLVCY